MYRCVNVAGFVADCTPLLERYVGFWLAYLIPCCAMGLSLSPVILGHRLFGESSILIPRYKRTDMITIVRATPNSNVMPQAYTALKYAIMGGFKMDAAKPETQLHQHGRQVPWEDSFVEDLKRCLLTCRVL